MANLLEKLKFHRVNNGDIHALGAEGDVGSKTTSNNAIDT